jgi:uncharacterized phage-associated protein
MTVSAHDVAAELRRRLPGLRTKKLHKLLYYCQGHHLAHFDEPLFAEPIGAWDMGPVVERLWRDEKRGLVTAPVALDEGALNTIGYVVSRYGALTGRDLEVMSHGESPWQLANAHRRQGDRVTIEASWMRDYFRTSGAPDDGLDDLPLDSAAVSAWLRETATPMDDDAMDGASFDDLDRIRDWATRGSR